MITSHETKISGSRQSETVLSAKCPTGIILRRVCHFAPTDLQCLSFAKQLSSDSVPCMVGVAGSYPGLLRIEKGDFNS